MVTAADSGEHRLRASRGSLGREVAEKLRARIVGGEFEAGGRMPSEAEMSASYGVSRVTIRTALKALESQGLVNVRHGSGTYVADYRGTVRTGLQELRSITETIRDLGLEPTLDRHRMEQRTATDDEADRLGITIGSEVIALERAILGDGTVMAYSYDVIPSHLIPIARVGEFGVRSTFAVLDDLDLMPVRAVAEVHAVSSPDIGWGATKPDEGLFLLLDQIHQDRRGVTVAYGRTYFVEGRFQFTLLRTR